MILHYIRLLFVAYIYNTYIITRIKKRISPQPPSSMTSSDSTSRVTQKRTRAQNEKIFPLPSSEPTTPDKRTHPPDPEWTGGIVTSKNEESTKLMLKDLRNTMRFLDKEFCGVTWQRSGYTVKLALTFFSFSYSANDLYNDPSADIEISSANSATCHTDIRLMSSYAAFSERLIEDLLKNNRTIKRSDWAWELRCKIGLRAVEDLALTVIAQAIGKKDHREFNGTYEQLIGLYLSTPRPNEYSLSQPV
jgi:hypothetical protein